jgi:hypothetical protein
MLPRIDTKEHAFRENFILFIYFSNLYIYIYIDSLFK